MEVRDPLPGQGGGFIVRAGQTCDASGKREPALEACATSWRTVCRRVGLQVVGIKERNLPGQALDGGHRAHCASEVETNWWCYLHLFVNLTSNY